MNAMTRHTLATAMAVVAIGSLGARPAEAQDNDELPTITARVHGTFQDNAGGLGVVSGDMTIARFEVLNGSVTAIGRIAGAMADSVGNVLGHVDQEIAFAVANVASTCNQLRIDLAATDAQVLQVPVHFDREVAGFDSREGNDAEGAACPLRRRQRSSGTAERRRGDARAQRCGGRARIATGAVTVPAI